MKKFVLKTGLITLISVLMFQVNAFSAFSEIEVLANRLNDYDEESTNVTVDGNINYEIELYAAADEFFGGYAYSHGEVRVAGGFLICQRFVENNGSVYASGTHVATGTNTYTLSAYCYIDPRAYASGRVKVSW